MPFDAPSLSTECLVLHGVVHHDSGRVVSHSILHNLLLSTSLSAFLFYFPSTQSGLAAPYRLSPTLKNTIKSSYSFTLILGALAMTYLPSEVMAIKCNALQDHQCQ